ncbi:MAG: serine/threonine protein kinase [Deltaproteobacteria bacterium]|nr:serine/threonine protein kinase [Deltaproteobacteria bacterium]
MPDDRKRGQGGALEAIGKLRPQVDESTDVATTAAVDVAMLGRRIETCPTDPDVFEPSNDDLPNPDKAFVVSGRYRIKKLIGRGSMGRIYLAEQVSVGRTVAIKIINAEFTAEFDAVARFQQEARLLASVQSVHIVQVFDIGKTDAGHPFIVMEFVDGPSLAHEIKAAGRMDAARTIGLLLQVASALSAVHEAGVVHRDLKPANIVLLKRKSGRELVKMLDFGLAKVVRERERAMRLTRAGVIIGTPEYMAPEQVQGIKVDHRADLYSVGCTAYEMLTGAPPFSGTEMATLYKHLHEDVTPLRAACPEAAISEPLEQLVMRLLAKDPEHRFADAGELYRALLSAAESSGISSAQLFSQEDLHSSTSGGGSASEPVTQVTPRGTQVISTRPKRGSAEMILAMGTILVIGLIGGVLMARRAASEPVDATGASVHGALVVSTKPQGASCSIDGAKPEIAPCVVRGLRPGMHVLTVQKRGFADKNIELVVAPGRIEHVEITLERPRYKASVQSNPPRAAVTVDGKEIGVTPTSVSLTDGEFHEISFRLAGYRPKTIFLPAEERRDRVGVQLAPSLLSYGSLFIDSEVPGRVEIDGVDSDEWTPTGEIQLAPGRHQVSLVEKVGTRRTMQVAVRVGETATLMIPAGRGDPGPSTK